MILWGRIDNFWFYMLTTFFNNAGKFHNFGTNTSTEFGEIHGILYNLFHNMFEFIIHIT